MNIVRSILTEIRDGKKSFGPNSPSQADMEDFQSVAKFLIHADRQGWFDSFKEHREARTANGWYDKILVLNGLSYEGDLYLQEAEGKNEATPMTEEDVIELKPSFMGIGINLNALYRWWKNRK